MRDRRNVDELSVEELEQILVLKRMEARAGQRRRLAADGRVLGAAEPEPAPHPGTHRKGWLSNKLGKKKRKEDKTSPSKGKGRGERLRDTFLLVLEVLALGGLLVVLGTSVWDLQILNRDVVEAREPGPTPTATPLINFVLLPGSSSPPRSASELPEPYRNLVQPMAPVPIPTPGPQSPTRVVIPAIGVDATVVRGDSWEQLKKGAGHRLGSANPGERGNMVISAHNDVFGEIFRDLEELDLNDEVTVYAGVQPYKYVVKAKRIVEPTEVGVLADTSTPVLTLITCYPYMIDTHRLVVIAELQ